MKQIKRLALSTFLAASSLAFITSCGSNKQEETIDLDSGYGLVKELFNAMESDDIIIDESEVMDIKKIFDIESDYDDYLYDSKSFKGYSIERSFSMSTEGLLNSISINGNYDKDNKKYAKKDAEQILQFLVSELGESDSDNNKYNEWSTDDAYITFNIYEDGYSLYVDSYNLEYDSEYDDEYDYDDEDCVGDFYTLKNDLVSIIIQNIKDGKIKIGTTSKSQMSTLTGDSEVFEDEYDGLSVSGSFSYEDGTLSSITLDYFYNCDGALSLLDMDKEDIVEAISEVVGEGELDGDYEDAGTDWQIDGQTLSVSHFDDGYAVYLN